MKVEELIKGRDSLIGNIISDTLADDVNYGKILIDKFRHILTSQGKLSLYGWI